MSKLPNEYEILMIQEYYNLDEGFKDIAPEFFKVEVNPVLWNHLSQLKYHRESVEKILSEEWGRLMESGNE